MWFCINKANISNVLRRRYRCLQAQKRHWHVCSRFGTALDTVLLPVQLKIGDSTMTYQSLMAITDNRKRLALLCLLTFAVMC